MVLRVSSETSARSDRSCFLCDCAYSVISAISQFVSRIFSRFSSSSVGLTASDLSSRVSTSPNLEEMRGRLSQGKVLLQKDSKGKEEADSSDDIEDLEANFFEHQSSQEIVIQGGGALENALKEWADGVKRELESYPLEKGTTRWFLEKNLGALETRIRMRFVLSEGSLQSREAFVFQELLGFLKSETKFIFDSGIKKMLFDRTFLVLNITEKSFFKDCDERVVSNYRQDLQELIDASQSLVSE